LFYLSRWGVQIMTSARHGSLKGIVATLLYFAVALPGWPAETGRVEARFEIFGFAGLHLLTNRTTVQEHGDRYAIATDLDTRGLASVFVDLTSHSEVHGKLTRDTPSPAAYRADIRRNGEDRHYGVDYSGDGTVTNVSTAPSTKRPLLVAAERIRGTVDQLTAYFWVERQLAENGTCRVIVPVFDGSGLYTLRFTDVKREILSADGYQNFAARRRSARSSAKRSWPIGTKTRIPTGAEKSGMPAVGGDRMIPVRMEFETGFGVVRGYLAELRGRGINLHLIGE
jgi:Protein of unknown function (DUF3108)